MYRVLDWTNDRELSSHATLSAARRACRKLGHDGTHNGKYYAPVSFVADDDGFCIYNPRFKKE